MDSECPYSSKDFTVIDTFPCLMNGKQHDHTDRRRTIVCTRAEYTRCASTLQTLLCLRMGVKGHPWHTLED